MKRFVTLTATALLVAGVSDTAIAQGLSATAMLSATRARAGNVLNAAKTREANRARAQEGGTILGPPSFSLMLGGLVANAVSAPEGADSEAGFMVRFQTTIPTASPYLVGVAGLQWAPNGTESNTDANGPIFFLGPVALTPADWTRGWLLLGLDALWVFSAGGGDRDADDPEDVNTKLFGNDLFAEFVVIVPFGAKIMPTMAAPLSGLAFVGLVTQRITNLGEDPDRFSPILLGYLSFPLAPWSR